jgi:pectin methylesterase-like acyl-CoA thioesterase
MNVWTALSLLALALVIGVYMTGCVTTSERSAREAAAEELNRRGI